MSKNQKFCKPINDGKAVEFAPYFLLPDISAPSEERYNAAGWFRNNIQPPQIPEGKVLGDTTFVYDEASNSVVAQYTFVDPPPPGLEEFDAAMEAFLQAEREDRGYTTREPDTYLASQVPRWAQDAKDWVAHRDAVMLYALNLINEVKAGHRPPPTMQEFMDGMPKITWTYQDEE